MKQSNQEITNECSSKEGGENNSKDKRIWQVLLKWLIIMRRYKKALRV